MNYRKANHSRHSHPDPTYRASGPQPHLPHGGGDDDAAQLLVLAWHALHAAQVQHGRAAATGLVRQHAWRVGGPVRRHGSHLMFSTGDECRKG